jgi:hypothetical protein
MGYVVAAKKMKNEEWRMAFDKLRHRKGLNEKYNSYISLQLKEFC